MSKAIDMVTIKSNDVEKMQEFIELAAAYPEECEVLEHTEDMISVRIPLDWLEIGPQ